MAEGMNGGKYRKQLIEINTTMHEILALRIKFEEFHADTGKGAEHYENLGKLYKEIKTTKMAGDFDAFKMLIDSKTLSDARKFAKTLE